MISINVEFCERLLASLAHSLWQGLFIGIVFAAATALLRQRGPEVLHAIGVICLAILVICVPTTFLLTAPQKLHKVEAIELPPSTSRAPSSLPPAEDRATLDETPAYIGNGIRISDNIVIETWHTRWKPWIPWITAAYLLGVVIGLIRLAWGIWACHALRRAATRVTDPEWIQRIERARMRIGLRMVPAVYWCQKSLVPTVVGIVRPAVLLPIAFTTGLTVEQMEQIFCHELTHIRRRDALVNLLVRVSEVLLFFNPVVWIISRRIHLERELCCDIASASSMDERWRYAQLLVQLAERAHRPLSATQVAILSDPSELRVRVETLLRRPRRRNSFVELRSFLLLTVIVLGWISLASHSIPAAPLADAEPVKAQDPNLQPAKIQMPSRIDRNFVQEKKKELEDNERKEQEEQIELSKNWPLKFPENVQANELAGVIVDSQGRPIEGALVRFHPAMTGWETTTDGQGMFRYQFKDAGLNDTYEIRFSKEGYSPIYRRKQSLGVKDFRVVLNNKTFLEGLVTDEQGKPAPNARVFANHERFLGEGFCRETATTTDDNGRYRLYLFPETYTVAVVSQGHGVERVSKVEVQKNQGQKLDLRLNSGVHFIAKVLDADTNTPVSGVVLYHRTEEWMRGTSNAKGELMIPHCLPGEESLHIGFGEVRWNNHGYFECGTKPLGTWWSPECKKEWHRSKPGTTEVGLNFDMSVDTPAIMLYVERGVIVSGKVTDPDGKAVAKATVAAARPDEVVVPTGPRTRVLNLPRIRGHSVETKDDGTYELFLPASGDSDYNLMAHDGSRSTWRKFAQGVTEPIRTNPGQMIKNLDIQLHRSGVVRGRVVSDEGLSLSALTVRAHARDQRVDLFFDPTTKTKDDGTFEIGFIRPGEHCIAVESMRANPEDGPADSYTIVELQEGETKDGIQLKYVSKTPSRSIRGNNKKAATNNDPSFLTIKLVDDAGTPVAGTRAGLIPALCLFDEENWDFKYDVESNAEGIAKFRERAKEFERSPLIYARHAQRQLVGLADLNDQNLANVINVTMYPECHMSLKLTSSELKQRNRKIELLNARIMIGKNLLFHGFPDDKSTIHAFLPPGEYELFCHSGNTARHSQQFTVESGARTLDLGSTDLPATRLEMLVGTPAPELQGVVAWKNSPPLKLSELRGKIVLLDFWGWWCDPCIHQENGIPGLFKLQDEFRGRDLVIIGVHTSIDESDEIDTVNKLDAKLAKIREDVWQGRDITFPVALTAFQKKDGPDDAPSMLCADYGI